jgi:hypothetical protein
MRAWVRDQSILGARGGDVEQPALLTERAWRVLEPLLRSTRVATALDPSINAVIIMVADGLTRNHGRL